MNSDALRAFATVTLGNASIAVAMSKVTSIVISLGTTRNGKAMKMDKWPPICLSLMPQGNTLQFARREVVLISTLQVNDIN